MIDLIGVAYKAVCSRLDPKIIPDDDGSVNIVAVRETVFSGVTAPFYDDLTICFRNDSIRVSARVGAKGFSVLLQGEDLNAEKLVTTIENCMKVFQSWT